MTIARLLGITTIGILMLSVIKAAAVMFLNLDNIYIVYFWWLIIILATTAWCRRLGILNFFEAILVIVIWLFSSLFVDLIVLSLTVGQGIYRQWELWLTYPIMVIAIFLFHKKRHIDIRRNS